MKKFLLLLFVASRLTVFAQEPADTSVVPETDPTILFFQQGEKVNDPAKTLLVTKARKTVALEKFTETELSDYADHVLADMDDDGKKELLLYDFTGGAHCCDEVYIFRNTAPGK